ncbi:hypothetical protein E2I00_012428 [Balaenoptera physalus]|uniref:3-hydroxyisobutyrate dehydrogenase, mitochondrial n=1 Tax=Balaenoptera physalus TaxID=9770 RepID=A0A643BPM7_BALPH|nr:hypothetical protein E2I00_012428 [Balaenoptera physalus]
MERNHLSMTQSFRLSYVMGLQAACGSPREIVCVTQYQRGIKNRHSRAGPPDHAPYSSQWPKKLTELLQCINALEAYSGANGIQKKVKKDSLLIDSSTVDPMVLRELAKEVEKMGAVFTDAPVSAGVGTARSGNLTFRMGGVELLWCVGSHVVHRGAVGTGQASKMCKNLLLAVSRIGTAEAMNLGISLGLDPKLLAKILNTSSGRCCVKRMCSISTKFYEHYIEEEPESQRWLDTVTIL